MVTVMFRPMTIVFVLKTVLFIVPIMILRPLNRVVTQVRLIVLDLLAVVEVAMFQVLSMVNSYVSDLLVVLALELALVLVLARALVLVLALELALALERLESADARPGTMVRMGMVYRTWDKMDSATRQALLDKGDELLANVDVL